MRIIARSTLRRFVDSRKGHKDQAALKSALDAWFDEVKKAKWKNTADVKRLYATASVASAERIVFNIKGNDYRLVIAVDFEKGIIWIKWIGTHDEYDHINVREVEHEGGKADSDSARSRGGARGNRTPLGITGGNAGGRLPRRSRDPR
jgi:mRNA interferase HigB